MNGRVAEGRLEVLQIYRLLQCVHEENKENIEKMVNLGVADLINLTEPRNGLGALHTAVSANSQELVSFLLSLGANPNIQDRKGHTPAMLAAELGNYIILSLLVDSNADLTVQDREGKGVLFYCIYPTRRHTRCLQVALKGQADFNNVSADGTHVFQMMCGKAVECGPMGLITLCAGADPNAADQKTGVTSLMEATKSGSLQLVKAILKKGADPNALDSKRMTAVHYAAMGGFFEVIQALSAYLADTTVINLDECTALHYAAATGNANCCKFLAQRGCNPKLKNQEGLLARLIAKEAGHKAAGKELRKAERAHGKGHQSTKAGPTSEPWALALHDWSHEYEDELRKAFGDESDSVSVEMFTSVLEYLEAPIELDRLNTIIAAHDKGGQGFLSINDFIKGNKYIKKPFLMSSYLPKKKKEKKGKGGKKKKGKFVLPVPICTLPPELRPRRPDGGPPHFMIKTYYNCIDVQRFDRDHPPEHPIVNDSTWYVEKPETVYVNINYSVKTGDMESLELALNHDAPVDVQDEFYKTPLIAACSSGNFEMAEFLLRQGADVNVCDQFFWTPLHHAAHAGQVELLELLLDAGASVDARGLGGGTPLMRAIESARPSCVDFLIKAGANVTAENKKEQNCLDIARAFADTAVIDLVQEKVDSLPKPKDKGKGKKAQKPKPAKGKDAGADPSAPADASAATAVKTPPPMDPGSVVLQHARITAGKSNTVDITFVPKAVWAQPPTSSQLMSKIERRKELVSLDLDFEDFMMPFSHSGQTTALQPANSTG